LRYYLRKELSISSKSTKERNWESQWHDKNV
jgi:hypothetical protein